MTGSLIERETGVDCSAPAGCYQAIVPVIPAQLIETDMRLPATDVWRLTTDHCPLPTAD
jgi:hypothetical protein